MRVFNAVLSRKRGGLEQAALDYGRALTLQGNETHFLLESRCGFATEASRITPHLHTVTNHFGYADAWVVWRWRRLIQQHQPDIFVAHGNRAIALGIKAANGLCPVVAVNHTDNTKRSMKADGVVMVNPSQKQAMLAKVFSDASRICVIPNMVTLAPYISPPEKLPDMPVIGTLARLSPEKGVDVLLEALALLKQEQIPFHCIIGGDGAEKDSLHQQAQQLDLQDAVTWQGWISDVEAFYRQLNLYVMPSRNETFGIVALEALMRGVPLVTTATPGVNYLLDNRPAAQLAKPDDAADLARAIRHALGDWSATCQKTEQGRALVAEKYDIQNVAKDLQIFLQDVIAFWQSRTKR